MRNGYASSMINGETVGEVNKRSRSADEINQLLNFVLERMNVITKKRNKKVLWWWKKSKLKIYLVW